MNTILPYIHIILAIIITLGILSQRSNAGLGGAFGSGNDTGSTYHTRRGVEKFMYNTTIVASVLFVASIIAALLIQ